MGADIHMVLERRIKVRDREAWVGVNAFPYIKATVFAYDPETKDHKTLTGSTHWPVDNRNYKMFAELAGVRGEGPEPRGVPDDASDLALMMVDRWEGDGHSHSWMMMDEAMPIFLMAGQLGSPEEAVLAAFKSGTASALDDYMENFWPIDDDDTLANYRLIFWFDN